MQEFIIAINCQKHILLACLCTLSTSLIYFAWISPAVLVNAVIINVQMSLTKPINCIHCSVTLWSYTRNMPHIFSYQLKSDWVDCLLYNSGWGWGWAKVDSVGLQHCVDLNIEKDFSECLCISRLFKGNKLFFLQTRARYATLRLIVHIDFIP